MRVYIHKKKSKKRRLLVAHTRRNIKKLAQAKNSPIVYKEER